MSGRALAVLTALVVVLAGAVWWSFDAGDDDRPERLVDLAPRQVAGLDLIWDGEVVVLDARGDDGWTVSVDGGRPRPAERLLVERFLGAVLALEPGRLLDDVDPGQTGLDRPRGRIALRDADDRVVALLDIGAPVPGSGAVVVRLEPSGEVRAVAASGVVQELATADWRQAPTVETPPVAEPSGFPEEPSRNWTERAPGEVDRIVLDSALFVGEEPLDLIRGPRDWVVVGSSGGSVPFPEVSDLLRAVSTARGDWVGADGPAERPVLYLTLADAPGARRETLTLFGEGPGNAGRVAATSTARPGVVLRLDAETARALERSVREVAAAVSDPGTARPASGRGEP